MISSAAESVVLISWFFFRISRQFILILGHSFYFGWWPRDSQAPESTMAMSRATQGVEVLWGQPAGLWACSCTLTAPLPLLRRGEASLCSAWHCDSKCQVLVLFCFNPTPCWGELLRFAWKEAASAGPSQLLRCLLPLSVKLDVVEIPWSSLSLPSPCLQRGSWGKPVEQGGEEGTGFWGSGRQSGVWKQGNCLDLLLSVPCARSFFLPVLPTTASPSCFCGFCVYFCKF